MRIAEVNRRTLFNRFFFVVIFVFFILVFCSLVSIGCSTGSGPTHQAARGYSGYVDGDIKVPVSATFGPDGRLWRVVSTDDHIFVDVSSDYGKTFSPPVVVNEERVPIRARSEYRAQIAVDSANRVYVAYPAYGLQPWTTYLSVSEDRGLHFSEPEPLSDEAKVANSFEAVIALDDKDRLHALWHNEDESSSEESGNSIYYSVRDPTGSFPVSNRKIADGVCSCCRLAVDFDPDGQPALLFRNIFSGNIRDHELWKAEADGSGWRKSPVSNDQWRIEACPTHGPALTIGPEGRYHVAWFTLGDARQGLFYSKSSDRGQTFSEPMAIGGGNQKLAGHPDVISLGRTVVLAWSEFDGNKTQIMVQRSEDDGDSWSQAAPIAESSSEADYPFLLSDGRTIFLSWNTRLEGYRLIPL